MKCHDDDDVMLRNVTSRAHWNFMHPNDFFLSLHSRRIIAKLFGQRG